MARLRLIQTDFTSGELDPGLAAREDATFYYSGATRLENVVPQPQGGVRGRAGWASCGLARGPLTNLSLAGKTVTAPLGSNAGNGIDSDEDTVVTLGAYANPDEVIYTMDYGSTPAGNQVAFDIILVKLAAVSSTQVFQVQYSTNNSTWTTAGTVTVNSTTAYSVRLASTPGENFGTPRYWRIRRTSGDAEDASFAEIKIYTEGSLGDGMIAPFTFAIGTEYSFVMTGGNVDIYLESTEAYVASVRIPHSDSEVVDITWAQSLDTMILFHKDVEVYRIFRLGADARWDFRAQPFKSVGNYPWEDSTVAGGKNEIQMVRHIDGADGGEQYVLEINGVATPEITLSLTGSTMITNLTTAIEAHEDITDVEVTNPFGDFYQVEFKTEDGDRPWPLMVAVNTNKIVTIEVTRKQRGREDFAPLWDSNHGFPSCGTFYQGRLWLGGFRDQSDVIAASRVGGFFDFDLDVDDAVADDSPLQFRVDSDDQITITQIHGGRHLQVFASSGEFYHPLEPITPTNLAIKQTSRTGAEVGMPVVDVEGGTFFIARGGDAVREYLFVDTEQSYSPGSISLLAAHLVAQPRSVALARGHDKNDAAIYYMANTGEDIDGVAVPASAVSTLRAQQVTAFFRITSHEDTFLSFSALQNGAVWSLVRREIEGTSMLVVERADPDYLLDAGRRYVNPDVDIFDSAEAATVFTYTFTSPASDTDVRVHTRANKTAAWTKIAPADYTVSLGGKTVTFSTTPRASGATKIEVRINLAMASVAVDSRAGHLDGGALIAVMNDRYPMQPQYMDASAANRATTRDGKTGHTANNGTFADDPSGITHPDGEALFEYVENTATSIRYAQLKGTTAVDPTGFELDIKPINDTTREQNVSIRLHTSGTTNEVQFLLTGSGTVESQAANVTAASIAALADGWFRLRVVAAVAVGSATGVYVMPNDGVSYEGNGSDGYYLTRVKIYDSAANTPAIDLIARKADFEVHYGYGFTRRIVTMPHRGEDGGGSIYHDKKRIPEASLQTRRCGDIEMGPLGGTLSHIEGLFDSTDMPTEHIAAALLTGTSEQVGMKGWFVDAALDIRGVGNMDFGVLSVGYRVVV